MNVLFLIPLIISAYELHLEVKKDNCFNVVVRDGMISGCVNKDEDLYLESASLSRYNEVLAMLHHKHSLELTDYFYANSKTHPEYFIDTNHLDNPVGKYLLLLLLLLLLIYTNTILSILYHTLST